MGPSPERVSAKPQVTSLKTAKLGLEPKAVRLPAKCSSCGLTAATGYFGAPVTAVYSGAVEELLASS